VALTYGQGSLPGITGSVMHRGHTTQVPSSTPVNTEQEAPDHSAIAVADIQTVNTRECLQCPANSYLSHTCPITFRDYKSMRIHVQQDYTYLVPQPAVCICSLTNVSTSDACKEPGCAWFFVDDISDDTTLADWYPGMNKHKHTPPYPLPITCPAMPYLDPSHQSPARFANIEDMRTHAMRFHKFLLPHEPVCPCSSQPHIEFPACRAIGCAYFFTPLTSDKKILHIDWHPGHNYEPTQCYNQPSLPCWVALVWMLIYVRRCSSDPPKWWYKASNCGLLA
jgi:hypothetical protein